MEWTYSLGEINRVAKQFWEACGTQKVFAFHGALGSGKTTFIHALCEERGVRDAIGSPTFSIINEYASLTGRIFHLDLYRLKNEEEAGRAGVEDTLYSGFTCLVEWPERAPGIFPADTVHVYLDWVDDQTRRLKIPNI